GKDDRPRVADFGLARFEGKVGSADASGTMRVPTIDPIGGPGGGPSGGPPIAPLHPSLTQVGMVMGTPLYMSPEQHLGKPADSRSDQFSFCVALYEALYQQVPFGGTTREDLAVNAVLGKVLPRPPGSNVPTPVHEALLRGLSCAPEQRFPSMRELLAALTYDPAVDLAAGPRSRRRVILSMFALSFTTVLGVPLLGLLGIGPFAGSVLTALVFLGVFVFLTVRFRHEMRSNIFHRATLVYGLVFGGQALFLRALGHLLGLSYSQVVTLDLAAVAATSCFMASMLMPNLWPLVPLNLLAALAAAQLPGFAEEIASASIALTLLGATLRWNNKVATRGPGGRHPLYPEKFPSGPYAKPPVTRRAKSG
ncbi:MAG TPA: hypothetical protein PLW65_34350, partial [Pseudomonadota bacterium]|nr:hypothetical protein [Pseudomonadota bacterium]